MALTLTLEGGPAPVTDRTRRIARGQLRLGRGAENDWVLHDPARYLSKHHCTIAERGGGMVDHRRKHQRRVRRRPGEAARARQLGPAARWQLGAHRRLSPARSDRGVAEASPRRTGSSTRRTSRIARSPPRRRRARPGACSRPSGGASGRPTSRSRRRAAHRSDGRFRIRVLRGAGSPGRRARATGAPARARHAVRGAGRPDEAALDPFDLRPQAPPPRQPRRPGPGPASGARCATPGPGAEPEHRPPMRRPPGRQATPPPCSKPSWLAPASTPRKSRRRIRTP